MYAIVEIKGQQFKVSEGQEIFVNRIEAEQGAKVTFDKVLLVDNSGDVKIGQPALTGASVATTVIEEVKGDKVIIFKKKRRKGYRRKKGHRQPYTKLKIESISL